jgi:predicted RNA-binding Zn-ribbon protein involved in translation (DUF1610 family)
MTDEHALDPADAFSLVGDEVRFRVLLALARADDPLAFSTLRERAGVDDSGQFNYHLGKLTGRFVRDTGDGYESTLAADRVVGAVHSGGLTDTIDADPVSLHADCPSCGAALDLSFDAGRAVVACDDCGYTVLNVDLPPVVLADTDRESWPAAVDRWTEQRLATLDNGFCLHCSAPVDTDVLHVGHPDAPAWVDGHDHGAAVAFACPRCENDWLLSAAPVVLRRPPVVAFYHDHGLTGDQPYWHDDRAADATSRVVDRDPLRVAVAFTCDGDTLTVTVDADLAVVDTERA